MSMLATPPLTPSSDPESGLLDALTEGMRRARHLDRPVLISHAAARRPVEPLAVFAGSEAHVVDRALWQQPSRGLALVTLGAAAGVEIDDAQEGRFALVAAARRRLLRDAVIRGEAAPGTGPLLLGGFSFDPARPAAGLWQGYAAARLTLPRLILTNTRCGSYLTVNAIVTPGTDLTALARSIHDELAAIDTSPAVAGEAPTTIQASELRDGHAWQATVQRAIDRLRAGELEKVVLARGVQLTADSPFDLPAALARLSTSYPSCTTFAVARGRRAFIGASPERLVRVEDGRLQADCLAGSARRGATPAEDARLAQGLLESRKDRGEHAVVARAMADSLADICAQLDIPAEPALRSVANIHHLHTPVTGSLAPGKTLLDAVARLHPTPAVAGAPRADAMRLIRDEEGLDRGWYAGPVGWIDAAGNGEFIVALRSGLVDGRQATLFAGCGVVADSDPAAEYAEANLKLRPMLAALGAAE